jgi:hypothetical protein
LLDLQKNLIEAKITFEWKAFIRRARYVSIRNFLPEVFQVNAERKLL